MRLWIINNKIKFIVLMGLLLVFIVLVVYNYLFIKRYDSIILNNIYIDRYEMSGFNNNRAKRELEFYSDKLLDRKIKLIVNSNEYLYRLSDLGFSVDVNRSLRDVWRYQNSLDVSHKLSIINGKNKVRFKVYYNINSDAIKGELNKIKNNVDVVSRDGYFDTSNGVKYVKGTDGYSLDVSSSYKNIYNYFKDSIDGDISINLEGNIIKCNSHDSYSSIDSISSSFVTNFDTWVSARATNLRTALSYINGAVVEPGEVFSYYKYAGPYDKSGYVFYYEFVGNGVCQIATTVYNAALLGGLEIVKRYPHAKKSVYVPGGLDATVASYSSGWNVDLEWKNTYKYPIYIKAYAVGGEAHVEFWSNSNAKEGNTYSTDSVWLGGRGYKTYLNVYKNNNLVDRRFITSTWYTED